MEGQNTLNPQSMAEVEALVTELYEPRPPQRIAQIQQALHTVQKSPEGWQLANSLLQSSDEKVQFFGALTFTIKLNTDSKSLSENDAEQVLNQILSWLVICVQRGCTPLVIRKLCSTLVVYFLHFSASWTLPVKHLVLCLCADQYVSTNDIKDSPPVQQLVSRLTPQKVLTALWFTTSLAEEVSKTDGNNIKHHKFFEKMKNNVQDVVELIQLGLASSPDSSGESTKLRQDSMKCFQAWVNFHQKAYVDAGVSLDPLQALTQTAIACLVQDDMYEATVELFVDVLSNQQRFLKEADLDLLFSLLNSPWSQGKYTQLIQGDFEFESEQYGHLLIAFGDARVESLIKANDALSRQFFDALEGLLSAEGYAVAEDKIFIPALEFWNTYVEYLIDTLYSEGDDPLASPPSSPSTPTTITKQPVSQTDWFVAARAVIMRIIQRCLRKIQFPPDAEFDSWDSIDKAGFTEARMEVVDLLQASYTLTGMELFSMLADVTLQSLQSKSWNELEASLFCLGGLVDSIPDDDASDVILEKVISSALFTTLSDPASGAPPRARQATLSLIGKYDDFFKKHTQYLPQALTFLFQALTAPSLAATASKSILSLCSSCRQSLTRELGAFVQQYNELTALPNVDGLVKERVAGAIAAIIQAIQDRDAKQAPLISLLQAVDTDLQQCLSLAASGPAEDAEVAGVEVLRCIVSIAKGLQVPADVPVDISGSETQHDDGYWVRGPGSAIQSHVRSIIDRLMGVFPRSSEVVDLSCSIFRAGFTEHVPGPFVFDAASVVQLITRFDPQNPRLVPVIHTACCFVSANSSKTTPEVLGALERLCAWVVIVLQTLQDPANDPETSEAVIDFLARLLPSHSSLIFALPAPLLSHIFHFILSAFRGRDQLPKLIAADFLSALLTLTNLPPQQQQTVQAALEHLGPLIANALIYNISGNAARSELDKVCDPLRKLVTRHAGAKGWLESALFSGEFMGSERVGEGERRAWLQKVVNLRGGRQTNQVVKNLWIECRGSNFAYTS